MKLRLTAPLFLTALTISSAAPLCAIDDARDLVGTKATIKQLIATFEATKNEKVLSTIEAIETENSKQQTIREKNDNDTNIKKWYCATGLGAFTLAIVGCTIIGIFHHVNGTAK